MLLPIGLPVDEPLGELLNVLGVLDGDVVGLLLNLDAQHLGEWTLVGEFKVLVHCLNECIAGIL